MDMELSNAHLLDEHTSGFINVGNMGCTAKCLQYPEGSQRTDCINACKGISTNKPKPSGGFFGGFNRPKPTFPKTNPTLTDMSTDNNISDDDLYGDTDDVSSDKKILGMKKQIAIPVIIVGAVAVGLLIRKLLK